MSRSAALGSHGFCKTAKKSRRASKPWRGYESSKALPPREQAVADQNLDCPSDRKPADAEPPSELRFTVDEGAGLTPRKVLSKPIKQLEVERSVEARLKRSLCHVHPIMRLTGQLEIRKVVSRAWSSFRSRRKLRRPVYGLFCYPARDKTGSPFDLMADEA
jgi:hypothetical protein